MLLVDIPTLQIADSNKNSIAERERKTKLAMSVAYFRVPGVKDVTDEITSMQPIIMSACLNHGTIPGACLLTNSMCGDTTRDKLLIGLQLARSY